jgi:hypothetical protein
MSPPVRGAMPVVMPNRPHNTAGEVERHCAPSGPIFACDFYVQDAEHGVDEPGGLRLGRILNVDHHAPVPRMWRHVTSTALAFAHLSSGAGVDPATQVVINHTDCDSMLSSAMLLGLLQPDPELVDASVCADHTGEENAVADLLQALDDGRRDRTVEQYRDSLRELERLRTGRPLSPAAMLALDRRQRRRSAAQALTDRFELRDGLAFAVAEESIDSAFFPALVPAAAVIMVASPNRHHPGRWTVKLRLGRAAPGGLTLFSLGIREWDPCFGGRWNAGSNGRGGGTVKSPEEYAAHLHATLFEAGTRGPPR